MPWRPLVSLLSIETDSAALPTRGVCPRCRTASLEIASDEQNGGGWHACSRCGCSGDLLELAAAAWQVDLSTAVQRLVQADLLQPPTSHQWESYLRHGIHYRQRIAKFWETSQQRFLEHNTAVAGLLSELQLEPAFCHGMLGASTVTEFEEASLAPKSVGHTDIAAFRGEGWKDILVLPFWDLPGRICAFLMIGRQASREEDFVYRRCRMARHAKLQHPAYSGELGISCHPGCAAAAAAWQQQLFAIPDPLLALRLQSRHLAQHPLPLPLAGWTDQPCRPGLGGRPQNAWRQVFGRQKLIFWIPSLEPPIVRQASLEQAALAFAGPLQTSWRDLGEYLDQQTPQGFLEMLSRSAQPWLQSLPSRLSRLEEAALTSFVGEWRPDAETLSQLLRVLPGGQRDAVRQALQKRRATQGVCAGKGRVIEHGDSWYVSPRGRLNPQECELIADARLVIRQVVYLPASGQTWCCGVVHYQGQEVAFQEQQEVLEHRTFHWLRQLLLSHNLGVLKFNPVWEKRALQLSLQFHEPELLGGEDRAGWDAQRQRLVTPLWQLRPGKPAESLAQRWLLEPHPGCLPWPHVPSPAELDELFTSPDASPSLWAAAIGWLGLLLGEVIGREPQPLVVHGEGAMAAVKLVCAATGSPVFAARTNRAAPRIREALQRHAWPLWARLYDCGNRSSPIHPELLEDTTPGGRSFLELPIKNLECSRLVLPWSRLEAATPYSWGEKARNSVSIVISWYLSDLSQRYFKMETTADNAGVLSTLQEDLKNAIGRIYRPTEGYWPTTQMLMSDSRSVAAIAMAKVLWPRVTAGVVKSVPAGFEDPDVPSLVLRDDLNGVEIHKSLLIQELNQRGLPSDSLGGLGKMLDDSRLLLDESTTSWTVPLKWWQEQAKPKSRTRLRIAAEK